MDSLLTPPQPQYTYTKLPSYTGMPFYILPHPHLQVDVPLILLPCSGLDTPHWDQPTHPHTRLPSFTDTIVTLLGLRHLVPVCHPMPTDLHNSINSYGDPLHPCLALTSLSSRMTWLPLLCTPPSVDTYASLVQPDGFSTELFRKGRGRGQEEQLMTF